MNMFRCFTTYKGLIVLGAAILLGGYLVVWHGTHVAAALPLIVLLACPLMHIFMHGGHGHHHDHGISNDAPPKSSTPSHPTSDKGE